MNPYKLATWHGRRVIDKEGRSVDAAEVLAHANDMRAQRDALLAAIGWYLSNVSDYGASSGHAADAREELSAIAAARGEG